MRIFSIAVCVLLLSACSFVKTSKNELKGVKEVADFYGGYCEYSVGASFGTGEDTKKYFELKITQSDVLSRFAAVPWVATSNAAYIFYKNLDKEKTKYNQIRTELDFTDGKKYSENFETGQLDSLVESMKIFDTVYDLIRNRNFEGLKPWFN